MLVDLFREQPITDSAQSKPKSKNRTSPLLGKQEQINEIMNNNNNNSCSWSVTEKQSSKLICSVLHYNKAHCLATGPNILNLCSGWRQMVSFTCRPLYPRGKRNQRPLDMREARGATTAGCTAWWRKIATLTGNRTSGKQPNYNTERDGGDGDADGGGGGSSSNNSKSSSTCCSSKQW